MRESRTNPTPSQAAKGLWLYEWEADRKPGFV